VFTDEELQLIGSILGQVTLGPGQSQQLVKIEGILQKIGEKLNNKEEEG